VDTARRWQVKTTESLCCSHFRRSSYFKGIGVGCDRVSDTALSSMCWNEKDMTPSPQMLRLGLAAIALCLIASACGGSDGVDAALVDPIETNDGNVLVKPPDVLEGNPEPSPQPVLDLPDPVEGLDDTPLVVYEYFDGTAGSTAEFRGRPTVLNFWASNCAACVAEMPEFEEIYQALKDDVDFIGVNTADISRDSAVALAEQTGVTYPLVDDADSSMFGAFRGFAMPTTVFLNPQGQIAGVWTGSLTGEKLQELIVESISPGSGS